MFKFNKAAILEQKTNEILELASQKKMLQIEINTLHLEVKNSTLSEKMRLEQEAHTQKLLLDDEKASFNRQKVVWTEEKALLIKKHKEDQDDFMKKVQSNFDLKLLEAITLAKLDSEQKLKQSNLDSHREITELKIKNIEEISKAKTDANVEYYDKMTEAFTDMQLNGDKNTKFVQEMALAIFNKVPAQSSQLALDVNINKESTIKDA